PSQRCRLPFDPTIRDPPVHGDTLGALDCGQTSEGNGPTGPAAASSPSLRSSLPRGGHPTHRFTAAGKVLVPEGKADSTACWTERVARARTVCRADTSCHRQPAPSRGICSGWRDVRLVVWCRVTTTAPRSR